MSFELAELRRGLVAALCAFSLLAAVGCEHAHAPALAGSRAQVSDGHAPPSRAWAKAWQGVSLFAPQGAWLGGDGAYSVDLGAGRTLWLFGDTFIDPLADGSRVNGPSYFVRNSSAIQSAQAAQAQSAYDPTRAQMKFYWGQARDHVPASFFGELDAGKTWLWPLHGARLPSGELLLFRMRVSASAGGFGFGVTGWDAVAIDDPSAEPSAWQPRVLTPPSLDGGVQDKLLGTSVLISGEYLYAYAVQNSTRDHSVYLARFLLSSLAGLAQGALARPQWWCDLQTDAFADACALPRALFADGQVELSVHYDARSQRFVEIQTRGLFLSDANMALALRTAERPEGPWSVLTPFYRPPEASLPDAQNLVAYAAKAHPEARGEHLLVTYVVNDIKQMPPRDAIYYPQAVALELPATP